MVPITRSEADHLAKWGGPELTPLTQLPKDLSLSWLLIPEITPMVNAVGIGKALGMHVATMFYDMIPLKTPEFYDAGTFEWLDVYWRSLASADVTLPISVTVKFDLIEWFLQDQCRVPFTEPCLLSGEIPGVARVTTRHINSSNGAFRLLATGSWEPRKNYPRIIRALAAARKATGKDIRLTIVGRQMHAEYPVLQQEMLNLALQLGGSTVELHDYMSDSEMAHLFRTAQATIFGSWVEGFGLPVLESLWRGLPCICHDGSALAEIAPGGGTIMVDMQNEKKIAEGIAQLAGDCATFDKLSAEAVVRPLRSWDDYATDVLAAIDRAGIMSPLLDYDPFAAA
jgi:glycosyltransferase involved in cell wall biosynthesis